MILNKIARGNIKSGTSIFGVAGTFSGATPTHGSQIWTTSGTYSWTVSAGVTQITIVATGGANGWGGSYSGSAGGYVSNITVTPSSVISIIVGNGGAGSPNGSMATGSTGESSSLPVLLIIVPICPAIVTHVRTLSTGTTIGAVTVILLCMVL